MKLTSPPKQVVVLAVGVALLLLGVYLNDDINNAKGRFGFCSAFPLAPAFHKSPLIRKSASKAPCRCCCCCCLPNNNKDSSDDRFQSDLDAVIIKDPKRRRTVQAAVGALHVAVMTVTTTASTCTKQDVADAAPLNMGMNIDTTTAPSTALEPGLLDSRVTENLMSAPPYGMEGQDIYYPSWFAGTWKVASTTTDVQAPVGVALFGGNRTFGSAQREVGTTLQYESRFITTILGGTSTRDNNNTAITIADREYNVRSIAEAAMGPSSVLDVPFVSPNKLTCILAPVGSPSVLQATLLILNRRQETISDTKFDCSEVVQEIVAPAASATTSSGGPSSSSSSSSNSSSRNNMMMPRILKQVETTSLYSYDPKRDVITCRQRSATYLLPSQEDPVALKMWQASRGRPVDVRFYDVVYTRR